MKDSKERYKNIGFELLNEIQRKIIKMAMQILHIT